MSHNKLRTETNCLNCDAQVDGRYCKNCGQENVEPKQTLRHLLTHFLEDLTHFDGKFFGTMKTLLWKPGFLSEEYIKGRRMKYLDPIRMYLFISAAFFIIYLSISETPVYITKDNNPALVQAIDSVRQNMKTKHLEGIRTDTIRGESIMLLSLGDDYSNGYKHYDSIQKAYPDSLKSGWIERFYEKKLVAVVPAYERDPYNFFTKVKEKFHHSISKIFFISLPIFSFFLFLLYIRRRKDYNYVSHAIFALHCYSVAWFFFAFTKIVEKALDPLGGSIGEWVALLVYIGLFAYLYIAMRRFYKQGWAKTFIKFLLLSVSTLIVILVIALVLLFNSFLSMGAY